jgi:hypothetical protein
MSLWRAAGVADVRAAAGGSPVYGLPALLRLDQLPVVRPQTLAGGQSSFERNTHGPSSGNTDRNNFLYVTGGGEKVMLDQSGPGTVYRIWVTLFDPTSWLRVYFDGEASPRINILMRDLFSGTRAPFLSPLVADNTRSSGGYTCYLPLPYQRSIRITTNMSGYYNIGYHTFSPDTTVSTWTGTEDSSAARAAWRNAGTDPTGPVGATVATGLTHLAPGTPRLIFDTVGPRSISAIKLTVPGVRAAATVTDGGRAHRGHSQFRLALDPAHSGVRLVRRTDYGVPDQRARVRVDGALVGDWFDPGADPSYRWRDSSFALPPASTSGKTAVTVRVEFVSSGIDWNEFRYQAICTTGSVETVTDTLDVADPSSEVVHGYQIGTPTWTGTQTFTYPSQIADTGRAHTGSSQFTLSVDPGHTAVLLARRMDHGIPDQRATVSVDGVPAGTWEDRGADGVHRWRDSSLALPPALTAGKSRITVRIDFASSGLDWNEFTYWTYSTRTDGAVVLSDTLDVGNPASEATHAYTVSGQTWSGTLLAGYDTAELFNNTRLRLFWDGDAAPSVDAPLGSFFGTGQFGAHTTRALVVGIDAVDTLYCYLPMPFARQATLDLVSSRALPTVGIRYEVRHSPFTGSFDDVGYLRTRFTATTPTVLGQDIPILDTVGAGTFIGVTASFAGDLLRSYLEGDERIYVDDNNTPAFYGTGAEDFFNGGFYFDHGPYTQPLSGNPAHLVDDGVDKTTAYRFFLQDTVPFRRRIRVSLQHGGHNETTTDVWTLAYYYQQSRTRLVLTDALDVAAPGSETGHGYRVTTPTWTGTRTYQYEGAADTVDVTDNGRAHRGSSQFDLTITPLNTGVLLRRRFDQTIANQRADVFVDGRLIGPWYVPGANSFDQWRDTDFLIPPAATTGKNSIRIRVQFVSSTLDWNEFTYWAYTLTP